MEELWRKRGGIVEEGKNIIFTQIFGELLISFANFLAKSRKYCISTIKYSVKIYPKSWSDCATDFM